MPMFVNDITIFTAETSDAFKVDVNSSMIKAAFRTEPLFLKSATVARNRCAAASIMPNTLIYTAVTDLPSMRARGISRMAPAAKRTLFLRVGGAILVSGVILLSILFSFLYGI